MLIWTRKTRKFCEAKPKCCGSGNWPHHRPGEEPVSSTHDNVRREKALKSLLGNFGEFEAFARFEQVFAGN